MKLYAYPPGLCLKVYDLLVNCLTAHYTCIFTDDVVCLSTRSVSKGLDLLVNHLIAHYTCMFTDEVVCLSTRLVSKGL